MTEEKMIAPPAILQLPGHEAQPARVEMVYRRTSGRLTRAILSLVVFWGLIPIVFFIPPHLPWALAAFVLGLYFAWSNLKGSFVVRNFEGNCPRCGSKLDIKPGTKVSLPHKMVCYHCHHEPKLLVDHGFIK